MNPRTGGVIISQLEDRDQLETLLKQDPFSVQGLVDHNVIEFEATKRHRNLLPDYARFLAISHFHDALKDLDSVRGDR
jgi:hypothetical protein